mmetsp:Transcript_30146/g.99697  ORF Transcript_30146/g.99697 Transcript_30146/m.99697 type:complete len:278 (+) Transcript_30146:8-841(+)
MAGGIGGAQTWGLLATERQVIASASAPWPWPPSVPCAARASPTASRTYPALAPTASSAPGLQLTTGWRRERLHFRHRSPIGSASKTRRSGIPVPACTTPRRIPGLAGLALLILEPLEPWRPFGVSPLTLGSWRTPEAPAPAPTRPRRSWVGLGAPGRRAEAMGRGVELRSQRTRRAPCASQSPPNRARRLGGGHAEAWISTAPSRNAWGALLHLLPLQTQVSTGSRGRPLVVPRPGPETRAIALPWRRKSLAPGRRHIRSPLRRHPMPTGRRPRRRP